MGDLLGLDVSGLDARLIGGVGSARRSLKGKGEEGRRWYFV